MGTWAAVTRLDAPEAVPGEQRLDSASISVAVVDTNAIISGLQLHRIADTAVTIPEVFTEVRDKHTRQVLASLPFALECQQPTEESVKAGTTFAVAADFSSNIFFAKFVHAVSTETHQKLLLILISGPAVLRFARATGDLHSLSAADIRLIALAHSLQLARHGETALKPLPELPSVRKGNAPAAKELPGWNESGEKWADMDKLTEEDLAEQELAGAASYCTSQHLHAVLQE